MLAPHRLGFERVITFYVAQTEGPVDAREHCRERIPFGAQVEAHAVEVRQILGGNAAKFFGFDYEALQEVARSCGPTVEQVAEPLLEKPADATSPCFW